MKRLKVTILIFIMLCSFLTIYGQEKVFIRGRVVDASDKTTIIGANIVEYDKEERIVNGTTTNVNGDFVLEMNNPDNTVRVSVIGYKTKEIEVEREKSVIVELQTDDLAIGEVTVTAEARSTMSLTNVDERDKASASVKVDLMEMQGAGILSASDALQGKVSGLDIIAVSGDPGSGSQLVIRGLSSLGDNQPLIVIDGIPQFRVSSSVDLASADTEDISNLINIALQDIKSIEVLKDVASTSVYGSQGADGVLLIETHKGRMGEVRFDYRYRHNLNIQPDPIPMLDGDEYVMLQLEAWHNSRGIFDVPSEIAYDPDYFDFYNYSANTDWLSEITQNGISMDHYFSISGGGEKTRYFTSFSYLDETGTTINTGFERFSSRVNLDYFLSRNLYFQIKFDYTFSETEGNLEFRGKNVREMAYIKAPNMSIWEHNIDGNLTGEYFTPISSYQGDGVSYFNPIAVARLGLDLSKSNKLNNTFSINYRFNDWLNLRETISFQFEGRKINQFLPYSAIGADWLSSNINNANESNRLNQQIRSETQLAMNSPIRNKNHELSGALTWIAERSESKRTDIESNKTPSIQLKDPSVNAQIGRIFSNRIERMLIRNVNNINYKYLDRYMLQGTLTIDAHSSFGADNRWGLFKGISAGWRFSSEPFLEASTWLGESMLRASWGVSGRQPGDVYARFSTYESTGTGNYITNPAIEQARPELSNLRWEKISSYNFGIEINLFNNKVYIEADTYEKVTSDILFTRYDIPSSSGFDRLLYLNAGEMKNRGWEIMADFRVIRTKDWLFSLNFNTSQNTNSFSKFPDNFNTERSTAIGNGQYPIKVAEGEPIGSFFGFRYLGVWPSDADVVSKDANGNILKDINGIPIPLQYLDSYTFKGGDPIYEDVNHDGRIDLNDVVYIGDSNPNFIGGMGTNLKYKNFNFSMDFHYRLGFDIINGIALKTQGMNDRNNQSKAVLRRWRKKGQDEVGILPKAYMNHPANNLGSDRYVEKGDFVRLNNIKIAYRFSQDLCQKIGIQRADIALSARKLFTLTNYTGQDPEVGQNFSNPFWVGVDNARTPPPKIFTVSVGVGL